MSNGEGETLLDDEKVDFLSKEEAKMYRGAAALINYYSQDCPEALFSAKGASKDMASPRVGSRANLTRLIRFQIGREVVLSKCGWQEGGQVI